MDLRRIWSRAPILVLLFFLSACAGTEVNVETPASLSPEPAYCTTRNTHPVSFTGNAKFAPRVISGSTLGSQGAAINIVGAEVKVFDSSGTVVNCTETNASGNFSSSVPVAGSYTIKIYSRGDNSLVKASVLNNPTSNSPYELSVTSSISNGSNVYLEASSSGAVLAGAFNIFHQVYLANKFLRENTLNFEGIEPNEGAAPKVSIYWTLGLSPGAYYNQPGTAISFFTATGFNSAPRGIYILGGVNGDWTCQDTDHFDNSIIIHEYGHFLEDIYSGSNSPGGSHDGNSLIDPRLAWSEGWANFIQAAVKGDRFYQDSIGNSDCSGSHGLGINFDLDDTASRDQIVSAVQGEGHYRELSVSRVLYDMVQASASNFRHIWKAFDDLSDQIRPFRSGRDLYNLINAAGSIPNLNTLLAAESQQRIPAKVAGENSNPPYAQEVEVQLSPCTYQGESLKIRERIGVVSVGVSMANPHQASHYYAYNYNPSAGSTFVLEFTRLTETTQAAALDWFIYPVNHYWGIEEDTNSLVAGKDYRYGPIASGINSSSLNFSGRPAGWYLIRIVLNSNGVGGGNNQVIEYNIRNGAHYLCPSP